MRRELRHVRAPLAQRRHPQHVDVEPVEQVLAEPLLLHFVLELAVRRRDDARVYGDRAGAAHASHLTLLEDAEQLRLRGRREVADLVEEQGAAARRLERPLAHRHGAREGAALVAEQLALHEVVGEGRAVQGDEGPGRSATQPVQVSGYHLLAGAALSYDQDRAGDRRDTGNQIAELLHGGTGPQERGVLAEVAAQLDDLLLEPPPGERLRDLLHHALHRLGFFDEALRAHAHPPRSAAALSGAGGNA